MLPAPPPTTSPAPATTTSPSASPDDGARAAAPLPPPPVAAPRRRTSRRTTWALAGAAAAGCAYVAVADPNSASSWYPACPFKALTGYDCPGCGLTRALHALLTGHPGRALDHNALAAVVAVGAVVWMVVNQVRSARGRPPLRLDHPTAWSIAAGVVVAAFWLVRNLPWGPLAWLGSGAAGSGT